MEIRAEQMQALERVPLLEFKKELLVHLGKFAPELHALRGDECFRAVIDDGVERAMKLGFTNRGPIRFFLESMLSYGNDFDTDPQIPELAEAFSNPGELDQMGHSDQVFALVAHFHTETRGPNSEFAIQALQRLEEFMKRVGDFSAAKLDAQVLAMMQRIYPEKFEFVGEAILRGLIDRAGEEAGRFGIAGPDGTALLCSLMFALGHGIVRDPLYPWVQHTLTQPEAQEAEARITRLRKKSQTYLNATLATLAA